MTWTIRYLKSIKKNFKKIKKEDQERIFEYLEKNIAFSDNPRAYGKALKGKYSEFWRYRVGKYRIICEINDTEISVLVIKVAHRKKAY